MRIDRVRRMVTALRRSAFCELMSGCSKVRSPIQRTNLITKDPDYHTCLKLWQFLENYDEIGYTIEERETPLEFDEEYQLQLFTNLITNYAVFKSLLEADARKLEDIPPQKRKVIKPKFIKQVQEEIVTDYNIPDVEVRKVIVEEVTQAQLDAEAKLEEETALRQKAEEAQLDAEKALKEYRWQADFQLGEAERQAEDRLQKVKADAQAAQEARPPSREKEAAGADCRHSGSGRSRQAADGDNRRQAASRLPRSAGSTEAKRTGTIQSGRSSSSPKGSRNEPPDGTI